MRVLKPHVEGMVVSGGKGLDVGDKVTVKLVSTDPGARLHRFCGVNHTIEKGLIREPRDSSRAPGWSCPIGSVRRHSSESAGAAVCV